MNRRTEETLKFEMRLFNYNSVYYSFLTVQRRAGSPSPGGFLGQEVLQAPSIWLLCDSLGCGPLQDGGSWLPLSCWLLPTGSRREGTVFMRSPWSYYANRFSHSIGWNTGHSGLQRKLGNVVSSQGALCSARPRCTTVLFLERKEE